MPVLKEDKTARICGDYKLMVNQVSKLEEYPLPYIEDLFATLAGGKLFTKLDMSQTYEQLLLDKDSKEYVTINTHKGLFKYLSPGVWSGVLSCHFPKNDGHSAARDSACGSLP